MGWLVLADIHQIQSFVFRTNKLRTIVGASATLDNLNQEVGGWAEEAGGKTLLSAGGGVQAVMPTEDDASNLADRLRREFPARLPGIELTVVVEPIGDDGQTAAIKRAKERVRQERGGLLGDLAPATVGHPLARWCAQAPGEYASELIRERERDAESAVSLATKAKHDFYGEAGAAAQGRLSGEKALVAAFPGLKLPETFEDIGKDSRPPNYMGLIVADANAMGEVVGHLASIDAEKLPCFSQALVEITQQSFAAAAQKCLPAEGVRGKLPCRILLMGGDDVVAAVRAQDAIPLAHQFCREFMRQSAERLAELFGKAPEGLPHLTMGVGVVIAHHSLPILAMHHLGTQLEKSAKAKVNQLRRPHEKGGRAVRPLPQLSAVDFQVITTSAMDELDRIRKRDMLIRVEGDDEDRRLHDRPYVVGLNDSQDRLGRLLRAVAKLHGLPRNRLKSLWDTFRQAAPRAKVLDDFQRLWYRIEQPKHREALIEVAEIAGWQRKGVTEAPPPWLKRTKAEPGQCFTTLLDAIELLEVTAPAEEESGDAQAAG